MAVCVINVAVVFSRQFRRLTEGFPIATGFATVALLWR